MVTELVMAVFCKKMPAANAPLAFKPPFEVKLTVDEMGEPVTTDVVAVSATPPAAAPGVGKIVTEATPFVPVTPEVVDSVARFEPRLKVTSLPGALFPPPSVTWAVAV